jgi:type IV pilus assembly protein PilB
MRISDVTIEKLLERSGVATKEQINTLKEEGARSRRPLQDLIIHNALMTEESLAQAFADYTNIPYIKIDPKDILSEVLNKIPERIARQYNAVLFKIDEDGTMHLAMDDPDDVQAVSFIQKEIGENTKIYIATHANIMDCLEDYRGDVNKELNEVIDIQREDQEEADIAATESDIAEDSPIAQTINLLLEYAIRSNASDIHIEPREDFVQIRYRIDGVLKEVNRLPRNVIGALTSRIKILSNLKIDEHRIPQDGQFTVQVAAKAVDLRIAISPVVWGEQVVIRLLDKSGNSFDLEQMGYAGRGLRTIRKGVRHPNGMVLTSGPTGSGKSTSLYALIKEIKDDAVNIVTLEDPVEYKMDGVNQIQVNAEVGLTFASGLRSILRQDPDVVMVGEIRDSETASLAVQAALTGHLVFSTLHTNSAAGVLPRLLDMGIEPFLIASTVNTIIGQRLVRRVSAKRDTYQSTPIETQNILATVGHLLPKTPAEVASVSEDLGYKDLPLAGQSAYTLVKGKDTPQTPRGYSGRAGLYEVMDVTEDIQNLIISHATSAEIQRKAVEQGMITMRQDGYLKALQGITTIEEVNRVASDTA